MVCGISVAAVIGGLSVQVFALLPGVRVDDAVRPDPVRSDLVHAEAVARVIAEQEAAGLSCRAAPALTGTVIVQLDGPAGVAVLPFDEAVGAERSGTGRIAGYCT